MRTRLRLTDNEWDEVDQFFRDTVRWDNSRETALHDMRHWVTTLDNELSLRSAPDGFISLLGRTELSADVLPLAVVSALVASRSERLAIAEQLLFGVLSAARTRDLLNAALCARSTIEVVADTYRFQTRVEDQFRQLRESGMEADLHTHDGRMATLLAKFRHAGRLEEELWDAPRRTNAKTEVQKLGKNVESAYAELSEICHPNAATAAQYWRRGHRISGAFFVPLTPIDGGSTPSKIAVMNAPRMASAVIVPFARSMWWMASILSIEHDLWRSSIAVQCGVPVPTGRNEPCVCGSGQKSKNCDHPKPPFIDHP